MTNTGKGNKLFRLFTLYCGTRLAKPENFMVTNMFGVSDFWNKHINIFWVIPISSILYLFAQVNYKNIYISSQSSDSYKLHCEARITVGSFRIFGQYLRVCGNILCLNTIAAVKVLLFPIKM